jgi:ATP-dependent 26S proteasome regulatory subunit
LNILDGVLELPGRIVVMTSNYIEHLDHALIRPGRIDIIADFKKCLNETLIEMIEFFYDRSLSAKEKIQIRNWREFMVSPAEMGKMMFEHVDDYRKVLEALEEKSGTPETVEAHDKVESHDKVETLKPHIEMDLEPNLLEHERFDYMPNEYGFNNLSMYE